MSFKLMFTDELDNYISSLPLGNVDDAFRFKFRLHNVQLTTPTRDVTNVKVNIIVEPLASLKAIVDANVMIGRCTWSDKLQSTLNDDYSSFPIYEEKFDTIKVGGYNEYEVMFIFSRLNETQKELVRNKSLRAFILVEADEVV